MTVQSPPNVKHVLLTEIDKCIQQGPGFTQEGVVLREVAEKLRLVTVDQQQELFNCWHDLFQSGVLSWGYNIDNPNAPFFHRREAQAGS